MKYWDKVITKGLTHKRAERLMDHRSVATRSCWEGLHFKSPSGKYCILLKNGEIIEDAKDIEATDQDDWMIVAPTADAEIKIRKIK